MWGGQGWRIQPGKIQGLGEEFLKQVSQTCFYAEGKKVENTGENRSLKGPKRVGVEEMWAGGKPIGPG